MTPIQFSLQTESEDSLTLQTVLKVNNFSVSFRSRNAIVRAVNGISLKLDRGEILCLVGESGCGKSVTAMSLMRLLPQPPARIYSGSIEFMGHNIMALSNKEMQKIRGNRISMIFQSPVTSLNPVLTVGRQITEGLEIHLGLSGKEAAKRAVQILDLVQIPDAKRLMNQRPHELSGGMCQRVMIAAALVSNPDILIADEPTTALDVTIQAQILKLLMDLQKELNTAVLLITHDLGVVAETAQRVAVMYAGHIVEEAGVEELFADPCHPYTRGLMGSIPRIGRVGRSSQGLQRLREISGMVPALIDEINGCAFAPRCAFSTERCQAETPELVKINPVHTVACWEQDKVEAEGSA